MGQFFLKVGQNPPKTLDADLDSYMLKTKSTKSTKSRLDADLDIYMKMEDQL